MAGLGTGDRRSRCRGRDTPDAGRRLHQPCELLPLFGDSGMDRNGYRRDQGRFCRRGQVQGGTHFLSKDILRRFYRLNGTVSSGLHGHRSGSLRARKDAPFTSIANPNPTEAVPRVNLGRDGSNLHSRRRGDLRSEYSGPSANHPIGRASGSGANRVHSHRLPARSEVPHRTRSPPSWAKLGPPVPMQPRLGRLQTRGSLCACHSLCRNLNR